MAEQEVRNAFPMSMVGDVKIVENKFVPLTRAVLAEDGTVERIEPALCWVIDGDIHVHPDRMEKFAESVKGIARNLGWTCEESTCPAK